MHQMAIALRLSRAAGYPSVARGREALWGYLFLVPWIVGMALFVVGPVIASLGLSFARYNVVASPELIGTANYTRALFQDELFWSSLERTFRYALIYVPLTMVGAL